MKVCLHSLFFRLTISESALLSAGELRCCAAAFLNNSSGSAFVLKFNTENRSGEVTALLNL
ncbi:hypothetical protein SDJN02_03268 [Cucurbita argyrosperma subsp. argyrosperma]|nr:hypothetical protein SDJN02_03268 [Cucurbita argyrosperma subsp. argyrosperma]